MTVMTKKKQKHDYALIGLWWATMDVEENKRLRIKYYSVNCMLTSAKIRDIYYKEFSKEQINKL